MCKIGTYPESGEVRLQPALEVRVGEGAAAEGAGSGRGARGPLAAPAPLPRAPARALRTQLSHPRPASTALGPRPYASASGDVSATAIQSSDIHDCYLQYDNNVKRPF